jgi:H+/Cl- antiporter ClcA
MNNKTFFKISVTIVSGAAAYTGAVTHSLSIAVIVCELTGQLSPLLPVLVGKKRNFSLKSVKKFPIYTIKAESLDRAND